MTEPELFDGCETLDEILFVTFNQAGPEGLRALLAKVKLHQQELVEAADKLAQAAGLADGAAIVREAAKDAKVAENWKSRKQLNTEIERNRAYWGGGRVT